MFVPTAMLLLCSYRLCFACYLSVCSFILFFQLWSSTSTRMGVNVIPFAVVGGITSVFYQYIEIIV